MKRDELISDCSDLDDIIAIRKDGKMLVSRIQEKVFMGKDIQYVGIWKKGDDRMVYNVIYWDSKAGKGQSHPRNSSRSGRPGKSIIVVHEPACVEE